MQPDALAQMVVLTIKSALGPVLERLAAAEAALTRAKAIETTLTELRDRIVVMETKASQPPHPDAAIGELRERVVAVETKAAQPVQPSATAGVSILDEAMAAVRDRLTVLETKVGQPAVAESALADVRQRIETLAATASSVGESVNGLRERVAVVEVRAQVPGPAGTDGQAGKDGADGLGFDDLVAVQQDDRSFTIKASRGDRVKDIGTARFPVQIQRGVYVEGKSYELGDMVTWAGSQWHCNEETSTKPGDGLKAWTLVVKRGRDGKDGRDAVTVPVVSVGRPA